MLLFVCTILLIATVWQFLAKCYWYTKFKSELQAHCETKQHHDATLQNIVNACGEKNMLLQIDGKIWLADGKAKTDSGDWPEIWEMEK